MQSYYGLPSTNEFPNMTKDKLETITQKVTKAQKSVGGRKRAAKSTEQVVKLDEDLAILKEYTKNIRCNNVYRLIRNNWKWVWS